MITAMETEDYMTPVEAAASLEVRIESVRNAMLRGSLPAEPDPRHPRFWLIKKTDVEAYRARTRPDGVKPKGRPKKVQEGAE